LVQGSSHIIRALNERFTTDSVYKHHDWNSIFNRKSLADTFVVSISGFQEEDANFLALNSVTLRNEIVGAPFFDGGTILFRDPWYLNSVGVQPDTFMAFSSPLSPTGAYNDTNRGVFLNQGGNPLTPPYYSVRAPLTQTIGNFQCTFVAWQATGATLVQTDSNPSGYDQKAVVFNSANAVVKARYRATIASITSQLAAKWNIVSVPDTVSDFRKNTLWPRASSHAFAYQSGAYVRKDTAENGKGYWLKFSSIDSSSYVGPPIFKDTIPLGIGWNLIGSLSLPIRTASIDTSGTGMQLSKYYGYSGTYSAVDTIKPGNGYWVKSYASGAIILDLASTSNNPASSSGVLPPPPTSPVSLIPTDGETNVSPTPTLSWEEVISAASYTVEVYSGATYVTGATVEGTSWTVPGGELSSSTTYSWQVQACNLECSEWSTATFTTAAPAPAPTLTGSYVTVNNVKHPYLSWTVPQGMGGSYQIYRYLCPPSGGDCFGSASLIATTSITHYTDLDFVYVKINPVSLAWYYVRADGGTSAPSNHVGIGTNAAQVQMHQNQEEESVELKEQKPDAFELFQNYPNGFNPTTQIRYALPFDIDVSLKVYDMLGRVVATLVEENQSAGFKTVEFNADKLSSGIYIYRLIAGDFTAVKKMIIVK
jgi:hypothetical protein